MKSFLWAFLSFCATVVLMSNLARAQEAPCSTPPMPKDVKIEAPGPSLTPNYARYLGVWDGQWHGGVCATLAVLSVAQDGSAELIYSTGGAVINGRG